MVVGDTLGIEQGERMGELLLIAHFPAAGEIAVPFIFHDEQPSSALVYAQGDSATGKSWAGSLVSGYLALASGMTPHALRIDAAVEAAKGNPARLTEIADAVRAEAPPLLRLCKVLGPNPRAVVLGLSMLAGSPLWYFLYQAVALNLLLIVSVRAHNAAAKRIAQSIAA